MVYYKSCRIVDGKPRWEHGAHGIIDMKSSKLRIKHGWFTYVWNFRTRKKIDCGTYICLGYDENRKNIISVWIIPSEYWIISKDKYKIDPTIYNDVYQNLMNYLNNKEFFGIEDIKNWLKGGI